jgi:hypothetical protein
MEKACVHAHRRVCVGGGARTMGVRLSTPVAAEEAGAGASAPCAGAGTRARAAAAAPASAAPADAPPPAADAAAADTLRASSPEVTLCDSSCCTSGGAATGAGSQRAQRRTRAYAHKQGRTLRHESLCAREAPLRTYKRKQMRTHLHARPGRRHRCGCAQRRSCGRARRRRRRSLRRGLRRRLRPRRGCCGRRAARVARRAARGRAAQAQRPQSNAAAQRAAGRHATPAAERCCATHTRTPRSLSAAPPQARSCVCVALRVLYRDRRALGLSCCSGAEPSRRRENRGAAFVRRLARAYSRRHCLKAALRLKI